MVPASLPPDPPAQVLQIGDATLMDMQPTGPKKPVPADADPADLQADGLIKALIHVESQGDDNAVGDLKIAKHAYGPLQIRQPVVDDVNRANGTNYVAQDCLGNRELSIWMFHRYMAIYANPTRLRRPVTDQDRARIWNGGPQGYVNKSTVGYWQLALRAIQHGEA